MRNRGRSLRCHATQYLQPWEERRREVAFVTGPTKHFDSVGARGELGRQPALADAGLAVDEHTTTRTGARRLQGPGQSSEGTLAPDEGQRDAAATPVTPPVTAGTAVEGAGSAAVCSPPEARVSTGVTKR